VIIVTTAGWLSLIIVGALGGLFATTTQLRNHRMPGGARIGVLSGLVGAYLGGVVLGKWGWLLGGLNVIGAILGALVLSYIVEAFGPRVTTQA
jgi:uncharacterized membrane protein YeaQ/YmgE (transglycosylase-associated protein family)